jgi:hypothetical protein
MKSHINANFRKSFRLLPEQVREQAREAYKQFARDPYHSSLHFKQVHTKKPIYSVRITRDYRALGVRRTGEIVWFWIGTHAEYDRLLSQL